MTAPFTYPPGAIVYSDGTWQGDGSDDDFPCCAPAGQAARIHKWIAPTLLDHYPDGPYAVHAYYPATGRELTMRNQTAESAVTQAEQFEASGKCRDVHVSLDTCG